MKIIKLRVGEEVFDTINFPTPDQNSAEYYMYKPIYDGFTNNTQGLDITDYPDASNGWEWDDNAKSFKPSEYTYYDVMGVQKNLDTSYFAYLDNNVVFTFVGYPKNHAKHDMYKAAFATGINILVEES